MAETKTEIEPRHLISAVDPWQFPAEPAEQKGTIEIAFLGRSNVGKSSLLNTLVHRQGLAFTSSRPGCTQMINFYCVESGLRFVDLPGYGFARVPRAEKEKWRKLIEAYLLERQNLGLCFLLLDARRGWMDMDLELKSWLESHNRRYQVIVTKIDKLKSKNQQTVELARIQKQVPDQALVPFSAVNGRGVREIWQIISKIRNRM
jgi:GTP-binding protein